jgi:hypothetical protein
MTNIQNLIEKAKKELADLTGFKNPAGIGMKKAGAGWIATIEIIEKNSIPEGMDLLGLYEVELDAKGEVAGYVRKGLRKRMDTQGIGNEA